MRSLFRPWNLEERDWHWDYCHVQWRRDWSCWSVVTPWFDPDWEFARWSIGSRVLFEPELSSMGPPEAKQTSRLKQTNAFHRREKSRLTSFLKDTCHTAWHGLFHSQQLIPSVLQGIVGENALIEISGQTRGRISVVAIHRIVVHTIGFQRGCGKNQVTLERNQSKFVDFSLLIREKLAEEWITSRIEMKTRVGFDIVWINIFRIEHRSHVI